MKNMITTLNITFGTIAVVWTAAALFITIFLFDSPTATLLNRSGYLAIVWSMPILTILSIILSRLSGPQLNVYFAWLPAIPLAIGIFFIGKEMISNHASNVQNQSFVDSLSKDYTCRKVAGHGDDEFLTVNLEKGIIVHITPYSTMTGADPVGRIDAMNLRLFPFHESVRSEMETFYKACLDSKGKNVYDRYVVSWDENGNDFEAYALERYKNR